MKKLAKWQVEYLRGIEQFSFEELLSDFENVSVSSGNLKLNYEQNLRLAWVVQEAKKEILKRWEGKSVKF